MRLGDPLAVAALAARHPGATIVIPHFGAGFFREALMAADARRTSSLTRQARTLDPVPRSAHAGRRLPARARLRRIEPDSVRHRFVVLPARLAEAGVRRQRGILDDFGLERRDPGPDLQPEFNRVFR